MGATSDAGDKERISMFPPPGVRPVAPFATWPVQHFEPNVGFYWYLPSGTFIAQSVATHGSVDVIDRHNDVLDRLLKTRAEEIAEKGGLYILFDWRSVQGYDREARLRQRERMQARTTGYARRTVIVVHRTNKLLQMAVGIANLFTAMLGRSRIELATSPDGFLAADNLEPPRFGGRLFPLDGER